MGNISTRIQQVYKRRQDGFYVQLFYHMIDFTNADGFKTTKVDKIIVGGLYRLARPNERSINGEAEIVDERDGATKRLIAIE